MTTQILLFLDDSTDIKLVEYCKKNKTSKTNAINELLKKVLKWLGGTQCNAANKT